MKAIRLSHQQDYLAMALTLLESWGDANYQACIELFAEAKSLWPNERALDRTRAVIEWNQAISMLLSFRTVL